MDFKFVFSQYDYSSTICYLLVGAGLLVITANPPKLKWLKKYKNNFIIMLLKFCFAFCGFLSTLAGFIKLIFMFSYAVYVDFGHFGLTYNECLAAVTTIAALIISTSIASFAYIRGKKQVIAS